MVFGRSGSQTHPTIRFIETTRKEMVASVTFTFKKGEVKEWKLNALMITR